MNRYISFLFLVITLSSKAQVTLTLDSAIASALRTHPKIQFSQQETEQQKALKKGSFNLENPSVGIEAPYGNKFELGVQQNFQNPVVYIEQSKLGKQNVLLSEQNQQITKWQLIRDVRIVYLNLQYSEKRVTQLSYQDSIFHNLYNASEKRYNAGDAGLLEKVSAETKFKEIENILEQAKSDLLNSQLQLQLIAGLKNGFNIQTSRTGSRCSVVTCDRISLPPERCDQGHRRAPMGKRLDPQPRAWPDGATPRPNPIGPPGSTRRSPATIRQQPCPPRTRDRVP